MPQVNDTSWLLVGLMFFSLFMFSLIFLHYIFFLSSRIFVKNFRVYGLSIM